MQFRSLVSSLALVASAARAAVWASPTEGQVLSNSEPFRLEFSSDYYFKDSTKSVTVLLSSANFTSFGLELAVLTTTDNIRTYTAEITPKFTYYWSKNAEYVIQLVEKHTSDYGSLDAETIHSQKVVFSD